MRKRKITPEVAKQIIDALSDGLTDAAASGSAGIDPDTLYNEMRRNSDFSAQIVRARAKGRGWHERNWRTSAVGDWRASMEWLARRYPQEWAKRDELLITLRQQAERLAAEQGLDAAELIAEAERIVAGGTT